MRGNYQRETIAIKNSPKNETQRTRWKFLLVGKRIIERVNKQIQAAKRSALKESWLGSKQSYRLRRVKGSFE